jgi:hypothetical protein
MSTADNFIYLTFALILLLLSMALAQQFFSPSIQRIAQSTTVVTLLVAVWGAESKNLFLRKAFIFPVAIIITALCGALLDNWGLDYAHLFLLLIFFVITTYQTAHQVLFTGEINGNKILGAICLYILLGLIWALAYTLIELLLGSAFTNIPNDLAWFELLPDFVYFSFVTMTTLGFGDISPTMPVTRFLVYFEAIVGQFYLAILVASLVGSKMSNSPPVNQSRRKE